MDKTPAFNLKVVLHETGLKADTIRAWERRYGLPVPERSPGGHRLYSRYDIETLKWLMARQDEGLSISNAVEMWHALLAEGQDPLADYGTPDIAAKPVVTVPIGANSEEIRRQWVAACLKFHEAQAEQVLTQAFAMYSVEAVCLEIIMDGLAEIGEGWYAGVYTVQQEHFASNLAQRRLSSLISASPPPARSQTILLCLPPDEEHGIPLLVLNLFLLRRGWNVVNLGANVPVAHFGETLASIRPTLVVSSATTLYTAASLKALGEAAAEQEAVMAFSGRVFLLYPDLQAHINGHYLGAALDKGLVEIERLVNVPRPAQAKAGTPPDYSRMLRLYREKLGEVEFNLEHMPLSDTVTDVLVTANHFLAKSIKAALIFGDLGLIAGEVAWITHMLGLRGLPESVMARYLDSYSSAMIKAMGEDGELIASAIAAGA